MRSNLLGPLVAPVVAAPGFAENDPDLDDGDREAIQQVISRQPDAFQRDDERYQGTIAAVM